MSPAGVQVQESVFVVLAGRFEAFSAAHYLLLALFAVGAAAVVLLGRRHRDTSAEQTFRRAFAIAIPAFTLPLQIAQFLPEDWDLKTSLPIQLCDLAWMAATYALWTRRPWAAHLTYFWGLTLTTQAIITPALAQSFPHPRFFAYWGMHFLVVWAAIYLTWGVRVTPTWRGYRFAVASTAVWAIVIVGFNTVAGTNYGYLNGKPASASILDLMGPWPFYILVEIALISTVWALMTWPWVAARRRSAPPTETDTRYGGARKEGQRP